MNVDGTLRLKGPPTITGIRISGGNVIVSGTDGTNNGTYYVLTTTNVTLDDTHIGGARGPGILLTISDTGVGMDMVTRARIFEPYSAMGLRSASGSASSGLGLAFCRLAAEAQGGAIRIDDGTPGRTAFVVELPR